ncbi:MAG: hypothetical protein WCH98_18075 [Verrucomicrobiota bacterium]
MEKGMLKGLRRGWCFGSKEFREKLLGRFNEPVLEIPGLEKMPNEQEAKRIIDLGLTLWKWSQKELKETPKGKLEKNRNGLRGSQTNNDDQ